MLLDLLLNLGDLLLDVLGDAVGGAVLLGGLVHGDTGDLDEADHSEEEINGGETVIRVRILRCLLMDGEVRTGSSWA